MAAFKVRAVDHFSWSAAGSSPRKRKRTRREIKARSINGMTVVPEVMKHDHLDDLAAALVMCYDALGTVPALWKADIDAAFRRIPIKPEHR